MGRAADSGGAPKSAAPKMASPAGEVEDLLQILQRDLLEEGPPACVLAPEGEVVYANKAYHRIAGALAEAGALPSQSALGPIPAGNDSVPIAVSQEHKLTIAGRTAFYREKRRPLRGADGPTPPAAMH